MEDTHGGIIFHQFDHFQIVLILIIMEDTHGGHGLMEFYYGIYRGLNPYYNGRYSWRNALD